MPVRGDYRGNVAVHPVSGLKRASGNGQLLHATAEIAGDKLAAWLEERVPLRPNLHPPKGRVLVKVTNMGMDSGGPKVRTVQRGELWKQPRTGFVADDHTTDRCRCVGEPVVADDGLAVHRCIEPCLVAAQLDAAARDAPKCSRHSV